MKYPAPSRLAALALTLLVACLVQQRANAAIRIDVEGVDSDVKRNVMALLSISRYTDRQRIEPDSVERLFRRVDEEVRSALRPYGYYQPKVESSLETLDKERNWRVRIVIELGTPVVVGEVSVIVHGPGATDPNFTRLTDSPPLHTGERLQHQLYEQLKGNLQRTATTYGYLDARMLRSELRVDTDAMRADVFLELETGERYRFGATTIKQHTISDTQMRHFLRYQENEPYDATKWLRTQFALDDSRYFSSVTVSPAERDTVNHVVPMEINAEPARSTYSFALGYGTDSTANGTITGAGPRGTVSWFNPHVNSLGHRLQVRLQASAFQQTFDTRYDVPFGDPALEKISFSVLAEDTLIGDNLRTGQIALTPSVTQVLGRWQRVLSVAAIHSTTFDTINGRQVDNLIVPGVTYASVPEGYLGENLFSREFFIELLGSHTDLGAKANFLRVNVQAERTFNLRPLWHLLLRGDVGATAVTATSVLPGQFRFFAGGDRSVRGFGNAELSPSQPDPVTGERVLVGGRYLLTGTVELERDLPRNLGIATFVDFGNAMDHFSDPLAYSAGLGFRWRLPGIILGIDLAQALRAPGYDKLPGPRIHLNIALRL
jgi:translocation and assembly module TamA